MKYLFSDEGRHVLQRFVEPDTLIAMDYDGTLGAIVPEPSSAHLRDSTRNLLSRVAARYHTLILTGRSRRDAARFLDSVEGAEIVGNHGIETIRTPHPTPDEEHLREWKAHLHAELDRLTGVHIEDKTYSLSIHYRNAPDMVAARSAVHGAASKLEGVRLVDGKMVLNVLPADAPDKGTALLAELSRIGARRAIFAGDDITDEDVFRLSDRHEILSVRIGEHADSSARYFLRDQSEIDVLLETLLSENVIKRE